MADTLKTLSLDDQFEQMKDVTFEDAFASVFGGTQTPQQTPEQTPEQTSEQVLEQKVPDFQLPSSLPEGLFDAESNPAAFQMAQRVVSQFDGGENDPILKALQELPDKIVQALRNG